MNKYEVILIVCEIFFAGGLFWLADYAEKVKWSSWCLFYLVPGGVALLCTCFSAWRIEFIPCYVGCVAAGRGFFLEKRNARRLSGVLLGFGTIVSLIWKML